MKTKSLIIATILAFLIFNSCTQQVQYKELRVLAWNIWHGGHSKAYPDVGCEGTINILKKSNADVILMIETYGAASMIADSLGFYYELLSSNLCIFSRYPITEKYLFSNQIDPFNFGGVEINIEGTRVRLFDTWLHYLPDATKVPVEKTEYEIIAWEEEGTRDDELNAILTVMTPILKETDSIPVIMGGDFNSHSHLDWTLATKDMYNHGGVVVNWPISKEMEAAGFTDSYREINPDPVTHPGVTWMYGPDETAPNSWMDRIDYIYYQGRTIQAIDSKIYNQVLGEILLFEDEDFFYASDHGFVLTTFKIKSK